MLKLRNKSTSVVGIHFGSLTLSNNCRITLQCHTQRFIQYRSYDNNKQYKQSGNNNNGRSSNYSGNKSFNNGKQLQTENRFEKSDHQSKSSTKPSFSREEYKPKFKSTVVPFEQYKKRQTQEKAKPEQQFKKYEQQPTFNKFNQQKFKKEKPDSHLNPKQVFGEDYDGEVDKLFDEKPYKGSKQNTRFNASIENRVDSYIKGKEQKQQYQQGKEQKQYVKKMPYIPANEKVKSMMQEEKKNDFEADFQDLTRVKKIDFKNVEKKDRKTPRHKDIRDPMSDDLKWIDEDEYRAIHQKGMKKMGVRNDPIAKGAAAHILAQSRGTPKKTLPNNIPTNVTFVMDDTNSLNSREVEEDGIEDDDDVIFYGDEEIEDDDFDFDEEEEIEEEKPKKGSKKVKKEQEEAPKIDILPDAMVEKYLKQIQKDQMSKNREFKSLPVVNGIIKEIFTCGLASKKSLKQAEYLQYFTSDEVSKSDEEAKSRNAMANMLSGNKVIEAQLKRQQVARKTNKTSLVYNQPELRADLQVKDDVVNWVFKNYKMKYIGSIGLSKEDELLLLKEQEELEMTEKNSKRSEIESLSKEELNDVLEKEENLYEFYRRNFEEEHEEEEEEEKKPEKEEDPETLVHKLYDISKMLEKCKGIPQVAFAGRSNVGKSSLINAITGRNNLKATEKPGQTKDLNFHRFGKHFCLVDMPGYGFAFTKDSLVTQKWLELIRKYFVQSSTDLKVVFLLIDSRLGLKRKDMDMISFLEENNVPYQIVFTKCDLMYVDDLAKMAFKTFKVDPLTKHISFKNHIRDEETGDFRMIFVSSRSKTGVARLKEDIVTRHSNFDIESWKKNVKKSVVMFV